MKENEDGLSSIAVGYAWAVRISTFSLEFAALAGFGRFIDRRFDCAPWGVLIGAGVGIFVFIRGLLDAATRLEETETEERGSGENEPRRR